MALITIPLIDNPDNSFTVVLDNVSYDMRLQWNGRDEAWYLFCGLANQQFLFKTKLTTASDILMPYRAYEDCPKGYLYIKDSLKKYGRLPRDGFSSGRFKLMYITHDSYSLLKEEGFI